MKSKGAWLQSLELGIKSDPILYRYSYQWLFALMRELGVEQLQLGSFFELYHLEDSWFRDLRRSAESFGVQVRSCFTAHRELGGLLCEDSRLQQVALQNYRRLIEVASLLGAAYCGSNPGAVLRDRMQHKPQAIARYIDAMRELRVYAAGLGLLGLTVEPMSSLAEPPATAQEINSLMGAFGDPVDCDGTASAVPVYLCGDISHGYADAQGHVIESNLQLFETGIPYMCEFHFKNTDQRFASTFGFSAEEQRRGIVDLEQVIALIWRNRNRWPVASVIGYLELPGPKLGRDYSDGTLGRALSDSVCAIQSAMKARAVAVAGSLTAGAPRRYSSERSGS
ncbi:MAG: sugar phosphate isomerase/epimerase [Spirochaetaceae bacterium]|nr:MAG: sugar phosphate isomerase/epimerase [Spirochaetaceae bacterium]